jgi:salicylate hydroxylase
VQILLGSRVTGIDFETPAIKLANGTVFKADLVIGADGLKSTCREALLGRKDPPRLTGDLAYRIIVPASKMREKECLRELVDSPAINYWLGPDSHAVGYLLKGGDLYNVVLACPDNLPEMENTAKADLREMRDFFSTWDPKLKALLELVQETSKWRLMNSEEMARWGHEAGKFVLLGDACHATLPYL